VEMPDQVSESEAELEPLASKALARSRKRARPASVNTDSDSDFQNQGYTIVRRHRSRASQAGRTTQGTQDIRNALALVPQPNSYE
jgi:hypothetical protein